MLPAWWPALLHLAFPAHERRMWIPFSGSPPRLFCCRIGEIPLLSWRRRIFIQDRLQGYVRPLSPVDAVPFLLHHRRRGLSPYSSPVCSSFRGFFSIVPGTSLFPPRARSIFPLRTYVVLVAFFITSGPLPSRMHFFYWTYLSNADGYSSVLQPFPLVSPAPFITSLHSRFFSSRCLPGFFGKAIFGVFPNDHPYDLGDEWRNSFLFLLEPGAFFFSSSIVVVVSLFSPPIFPFHRK